MMGGLAIFSLLIITMVVGINIFWVWALIDCATRESSEGNDKLIWVVIILLTHLGGALIYYFVRRPQRIQELGR